MIEPEAWFQALSALEQDQIARRVGTWLVAPPEAVRREIAVVGLDLRALGRVFAITETCAAMRVPEVGAGPGVAVVTPHEIHRRGAFPGWVADGDLRAIAEQPKPRSLRRAAIRDEPGRVALFARAS
jgi:hypothetical protein